MSLITATAFDFSVFSGVSLSQPGVRPTQPSIPLG